MSATAEFTHEQLNADPIARDFLEEFLAQTRMDLAAGRVQRVVLTTFADDEEPVSPSVRMEIYTSPERQEADSKA